MFLKINKKEIKKGFTQVVDFGFVFENVSKKFKSLFSNIMSGGGLKFQKTKTFSKPKFTTGFTLVESLVAISILMVAIVTPMTIAQKGLGSANYSKDQMTASFLAQDALEFIKNKRDEIGVTYDVSIPGDPPDWLGEINIGCKSPSLGCDVDTIDGSYVTTNPKLNIYRNNAGEFFYYGHKGVGLVSEPSKFARNVKIEKINNDEASIVVTVKWQSTNGEEKVEVKNFIYNYWENL
jgi:type II secretory pathway pseudopilin PulG